MKKNTKCFFLNFKFLFKLEKKKNVFKRIGKLKIVFEKF